MKNNKIIYKIAILLSAFFVLNCGGLSTTNGGGHGHGPGNADPKVTCKSQGKLSTDNTGACFKAEATPANFGELVTIIDKKLKANINADLNKIDVSKVTTMHCLFGSTTCTDIAGLRPAELTGKDFHLFNGKIDKWNVSEVISMNGMFKDASNFNQDISGWNVSKVENMIYMFSHATNFNQDIGGWNVSKVTYMMNMFEGASSFNQDISKWKVGNVEGMDSMFQSASKFNQDISGWNVNNVTSMIGMFKGASSFNQDLGSWDVSNVTDMNAMFINSAMSHPLEAWGGKLLSTVQKSNVFNGSPVATGNNYPTWCTTTNHCH